MENTYTGKVCKRCSTTLRYSSTKRCVECKKTYKINRRADPELLKLDQDYFRRRYHQHKPELRQSRIQRKYGLTPEQHAAMVEDAKGSCAICKQEPRRGLVIDHCHDTGKVRGLLCGDCNVALGLLRDNPDHLAAAISYLAHHSDN